MEYLSSPRSEFRTIAANTEPLAYDAAFAEDDAKIVLTSSDKVHYRVHSFTLRTTSGFFRDMISLPQPHDTQSREDVIALDETSHVLGTLLRIICGLGVMKWESYDHVEDVLAAAQKYDMMGPMMTIRSVIMTPAFVRQPLRLYSIAARFGWEEEAKFASKHTLNLSLHDTQHSIILERTPITYVLRLFRLHRVRRDEFKKHAMRDGGCFGIQNCPNCNNRIQNTGSLSQLTNLIVWEMDQDSSGNLLLEGRWKEWPIYKNKEGTCPSCGVAFRNHQEYGERISTDIRSCIQSLPSTI
jgi:hypothetical protein